MKTVHIRSWSANVGCGWSETYLDIYPTFVELYHFGYRNSVRRWRVGKTDFKKVIKETEGKSFSYKIDKILNSLWDKRHYAPKEFVRIR